MEAQGWIKIHRKIVDWQWYKDIPCRILFEHLLYTANHKPAIWQLHEIKRGEKITSVDNLAFETGLTLAQVRFALKKLKLTGEIATKTTNKFTLITVACYESYQAGDKQNDKPLANESQTNDKPLATNKNDKNIKNGKNEKNIYTPEFELFWQAYPPNKASKAESFKSFQTAIKEASHDDIIRAAGSYRADIERTGSGVQYTAHAKTWLNQRRWTVEYEQLGRNAGTNGGNASAKMGGGGKSALTQQVDRVKAKILGGDLHPAKTARDASGEQGSKVEGSNLAGVLLDDVKFIRQENG